MKSQTGWANSERGGTVMKHYCTECGYDLSDYATDETMCGACLTEYWSHYCEECGAEPEQSCIDGCVNAHKGCLV